MELNTAAAVIRFAAEVEEKSAKFYDDCAKKHREMAETFLSFVSENKKNVTFVKRAYYGVITDALEACFSFEGLKADEFLFSAEFDASAHLSDILEMSLEMEDKIQKFYQKAEESSEKLLADVPRALKKVAEKRDERKRKLESLLHTLGVEQKRVDYYQELRDLRNKDIYEGSIHVSEREVEEAIEEAVWLQEQLHEWLAEGRRV